MSRPAREKDKYATYHIIVKSISEIQLFEKDKDKKLYLTYMKHYQKLYNFKVYAYCLMTNHGHFIINSNGGDITKIMHGLNTKYVAAFNKSHKREGHLFKDRFKSIIVDTNDYLTTLSAYIHRNPIAIREYTKCPEKYKYSSLKVYLGMEEDETGLLDVDYILKYFGKTTAKARESYLKFVYVCDYKKLKEEMELQNQGTESKNYKKVLIRDASPEDVLEFVAKETEIKKVMIYVKNNRKSKVARALAALLMRSLCNCSCGDICRVLGNITQSRVSVLCSIGLEIIEEEKEYEGIIDRFISAKGRYMEVPTCLG